MRIGTMGNAGSNGPVRGMIAEASAAAADGLHTYWTAQTFGHDALTALAVTASTVPDIELGTAVVPTYPRHPAMLAQQALTVQSASAGRLCLGIGLSHQVVVEDMWGLSFDKPVRHIREYLSVLMPLLETGRVAFQGEDYRVNVGLTLKDVPRPSVVIAALGPKMLHLAGSMADGTSTWCTGPKTLSSLTVPTLNQAAADAGRPAPRVIASLPVCVTDDVDAARARAAKVFAMYNNLPSYRAMMDREGVAGPSDLAIVGTEAEVGDQLAEVAAAGATDFNASEFSANPEDKARTRALLRGLAATSV